MALDPWKPESGWTHLREGQALYAVRFAAGQFRTHHAMLVRAAPTEPAKVLEGLRVRVTHMQPPSAFREDDPEACWELSDTVYLGSFSGPDFDDTRYQRVSEEMRRLEHRAVSTKVKDYSLASA